MLGSLVAALALMLAPPVPATGAIRIGEAAPDCELTLVDGAKVRLSDMRGQVVVLNFWATWCAPCRQELPLLDSFYRLRKDNGLRVFAVTTEDSLPLYRLRKVFAAMTIHAVRKVRGPYKVMGALPTNYIIDRAGKVRHAKAGALELNDLNQHLIPLLREPAPAG